MRSKETLVRQVNWLFIVPQLLVIALLTFVIAYFFNPASWEQAILYACAIDVAVSFALRAFACRSQQQGIQLANSEQYEPAIANFQHSYDFFSKYKWLDNFRSITLMSPSAISYREMALINIAFCYTKLHKSSEAQSFYQKTLAEFPDSKLAKEGLSAIK